MNPFFIDQMAMYSAYHRDGRNRATHFIGIPMIVLSIILACSRVPLGPTDLAAVLLLGIGMLYLWLDWRLGLPMLALYTACYAGLRPLAGVEAGLFWTAFAVLFVGGWIFQLVGHVFEGRRPALLDNLLQALIAPLFLLAETLFALGFRRDLEAAMQAAWPKYRFGEAAAAR